MKHAGKARKAAFKLILISLVLVAIVLAMGVFAAFIGAFIVAVTPFLVALWVAFALFTVFFFRDPNARVPATANVVVSPAHAKVDVIDTVNEPLFMGGECRRISMFLSVFDVHVQNAPIGGKVALYKYTTGQFLNALRTESATHNENALMGFIANDPAGVKIGVRLVAGVLARRIVPFIEQGDEVSRGDRVSLIQFGSRADVYLPMNATINVKIGDKLVGGETVIATLAS